MRMRANQSTMMKVVKNVAWSVTVAAVLLTGLPGISSHAEAAASRSIEVLLNARKMSFPDAKPFQDTNSAVMVPIRFVSEKLGAKVGWSKSGSQQVVTLKTDQHSVSMIIGSTTAVIDGESKQYDSKVILKQSRTFVPLRLVSEGLGQKVEWDSISRWVWIGSKEVPGVDQLNVKTQSLESYKNFFNKSKFLLKNIYGTPYENVLLLNESQLPVKLLSSIYDIEPYSSHGVDYLRVRSTGIAPDLFYITNKGDVRFRAERSNLAETNKDNTKYHYYQLVSYADKDLDGIVDAKPLTIKDVKYIGFNLVSEKSMVLMPNPWSN
ncbi:stalk domain-containing protein [Paenibacillus sp. Z6-24]